MKYIKGNPYSYNSIVYKNIEKEKDRKFELSDTAQATLTDPICNFVGHYFGVNMKQEWAKNYQKVKFICDYASDRLGDSQDLNPIMDILKEKLNASPEVGETRLDDLVNSIKLEVISRNQKKVDHNGNEKEEVLNNV